MVGRAGPSKQLGPVQSPLGPTQGYPHCYFSLIYKPGCWCCTPGPCTQLWGYAPKHADAITSLPQHTSHVTLGIDSTSRKPVSWSVTWDKEWSHPHSTVRHCEIKARKGLIQSPALGNFRGIGQGSGGYFLQRFVF